MNNANGGLLRETIHDPGLRRRFPTLSACRW
jgi:hypothetical protein